MSDEVLDAKWYTGAMGGIGIVLIRHERGVCAYIGFAPGANEQADVRMIREWGARFHEGPALWPKIPADQWALE